MGRRKDLALAVEGDAMSKEKCTEAEQHVIDCFVEATKFLVEEMGEDEPGREDLLEGAICLAYLWGRPPNLDWLKEGIDPVTAGKLIYYDVDFSKTLAEAKKSVEGGNGKL